MFSSLCLTSTSRDTSRVVNSFKLAQPLARCSLTCIGMSKDESKQLHAYLIQRTCIYVLSFAFIYSFRTYFTGSRPEAAHMQQALHSSRHLYASCGHLPSAARRIAGRAPRCTVVHSNAAPPMTRELSSIFDVAKAVSRLEGPDAIALRRIYAITADLARCSVGDELAAKYAQEKDNAQLVVRRTPIMCVLRCPEWAGNKYCVVPRITRRLPMRLVSSPFKCE